MRDRNRTAERCVKKGESCALSLLQQKIIKKPGDKVDACGGSLGISLLILLLIPTGIYFTIRTRFLPIRLFPDMIRALSEKKNEKSSLSSFQTLIVSTATRVGMGNLVGVVAAVSAGGAGAVFWMWVTAIIGSSTAFIEATLAQLHKEEEWIWK